MKNWNSLSMRDRADIIKLGVTAGITDLSVIRQTYEDATKYDDGGDLDGKYAVGTSPEKIIARFDTKEERDSYITEKGLEPVFRESLPELTVSARRPRGVLEMGANNFEETFGVTPRDALGVVPYIGDALGVYQIGEDLQEGEYTNAALGLGLLALPNIIEKPLKASYRGVRNLLRTARLNSTAKGMTRAEKLKRLAHPNRTAEAYERAFGDAKRSVTTGMSTEGLEDIARQVDLLNNRAGNPKDRVTLFDLDNYEISPQEQLRFSNETLDRAEQLAADYSTKMKALESNPVLHDIATESPQYLDIIYNDLKAGKTADIENYVRGLVTRANTFSRRMEPSPGTLKFTPEQYLSFPPTRGGGLGSNYSYTPGSRQLNVGNKAILDTGDYGSVAGVYRPKDMELTGDVGTWWSQRFPEIPGIETRVGMHSGPVRLTTIEEGVPYEVRRNAELLGRNYLNNLNVPLGYRGNSGHIVFDWEPSDFPASIASKFDVDIMPYDKYLKRVDNDVFETLGYKYGGKMKRFDGGGQLSNSDKIITTGNEYADIGLSFVPFVGSAMDWETAIREPSIGNYALAALGTGLDIFGASLIKGSIKTAKASARAAQAVERAEKAAAKYNRALHNATVNPTRGTRKIVRRTFQEMNDAKREAKTLTGTMRVTRNSKGVRIRPSKITTLPTDMTRVVNSYTVYGSDVALNGIQTINEKIIQ